MTGAHHTSSIALEHSRTQSGNRVIAHHRRRGTSSPLALLRLDCLLDLPLARVDVLGGRVLDQ
jgi:hypothetical protein